MTKQNRERLVSFLVAGFGALVAEHFLKPRLKGMFKA